jgi:hypothetical protein
MNVYNVNKMATIEYLQIAFESMAIKREKSGRRNPYTHAV